MKRTCLRGWTETGLIILAILSARVVLAQEGPRTPRPTTPPPPTGSTVPSASPFRTPEDGPVPTPPMAPPTPRPDDRIAVQLKDGSRILGKLSGLEKIKAKSTFGEIAIPVDALLGLRMADMNNGPPGSPGTTSTILFRNGDVLTAEPVLGTLKLETSFGEVAIPGKHVESIVTTTERMVWVNDGKWRLAPEVTGPPGMTGMPMRGGTYGPGPYILPYGPPGSSPYLPGPGDLAPPAFPPTIPSITPAPPTP